jgi:anti-sigma factor RsiW
MDHTTAANRLSAYIDNELPADLRAALEGHLAACPVCAADLAALRKTSAVIHQLPAAELSPPAFVRLHIAIDASSRKPLERFVGLLSGIAACLALFAGLMLFRPAAAAPLAAPVPWESTATQLPEDSTPLANSQESAIGQWMVSNLTSRGD